MVSQQHDILNNLIKDLEEDKKRKARQELWDRQARQDEEEATKLMDKLADRKRAQPDVEDVLE